jgi:hypothetical protein
MATVTRSAASPVPNQGLVGSGVNAGELKVGKQNRSILLSRVKTLVLQ